MVVVVVVVVVLNSWNWLYVVVHNACKRRQCVLKCNFMKNQRILMPFLLLDLHMNGTHCDI